MPPVSPARTAAFAVVRRVFESGAYADRALRAELERLEDPRDRALAKRLAFGTVQRKGTLEWVVGRLTSGHLEHQVRAALWLGLYELLFSGAGQHAAVSAAVELAKPSPGHKVVNAVLRRVAREGVELPDDVHPAGAAVRHSHPEWIVRLWWKALGAEETRRLLAADNEPAESVLRINPLVPFDEAELPPGRREGDALVLDAPFDVAGSELFARGAITPQSRAAQRVSVVVDPQPGERVLDLCAAPGGKTTHLAALMGGEGTVVAVERHAGRASALETTAKRMGAHNVVVVLGDAGAELGHHALRQPFDRVLVDPPCSGLGTLRSNPDLRWRMTPETVERLIVEQDKLVAAARARLRPGGALVYSTCTINPEEERVRGAEREQTYPHRDGTDGFYTARE
ncbi:MAG: 16S rRNA (cytosine(967)-C(5))-methyltransferase [uncultured Solirubrobacteraceae bacterium]|uniref:16S rRNA (Cytosine(967)-C(5))-methyltransferase n=1 Tax=uncultured Solirubrobacteraceae bacterium TaxID=1162706 RepID=A0A6J4T455_9ACTN|nr:MAG: 16S rRNA (cytosine(967)-C(5))-methyltransferase [uncultured Solirubrobacteraceae bacterium]